MSPTDCSSRLARASFTRVVALCVGAAMGAGSASGAWAHARHHHRAASAKKPVLVELFTAQGCATCQPADATLADLAKRKDVLALTFSVDIWDFLGWSDTFAQPEFTARQRAYVKRLRLREMSTPEMVVQGGASSPGLDADEVGALIDDADRAKTPSVVIAKGSKRVAIGRGAAASAADVWLVRYDPKTRSVSIKTGESRGKTVTETNVVRQLVRLGAWTGAAKSFVLPPYAPPPAATGAANPAPAAAPEALKTAIIVQAAHGGKVMALGRE
jgi:hypothetical protein